MKTEQEFKVVVLGDSNVGKTSILSRFEKDTFDPLQPSTIGLAYITKTIELPNQRINLKVIWDTAGQEKYRSISKMYYKNSDGVLLVFDVTNKESLSNVVNWYTDLRDNVNGQKIGQDKSFIIVVFIVANKSDLNNNFDQAQLNLRSEELGARVLFSSAKTGDGIKNLFTDLAQALVQKDFEIQQSTTKLNAKNAKTKLVFIPQKSTSNKKQKKRCC